MDPTTVPTSSQEKLEGTLKVLCCSRDRVGSHLVRRFTGPFKVLLVPRIFGVRFRVVRCKSGSSRTRNTKP